MQDWTPERVADRMQITEVLHHYCRAIDRIQPGDLASKVFHPDAIVDKGDPVPVAEFIAYVEQRHPGVPTASHMSMNAIVEFTGQDSAFVESWCLAVERQPPAGDNDAGSDIVVRVRYGDHFERRGGRWLIARRTFVLDHMIRLPADPTLQPPGASIFQGKRDASDPLMRIRAGLGLI